MNISELFDERYNKIYLNPGNRCCPGCTGPIHLRYMLETALESEKDAVVMGGGPCAGSVRAASDIPRFGMHFSSGPDVAAGIVSAYEALGKCDYVLVNAGGDGNVSEIAFSKVSACAERNQNMVQVCVDNEAYMNTGIQKSGTTPLGAWTTTTPQGKGTSKKNLPMIMVQHRVPYAATLSVAYPQDFKKKFRKALDIKGYRYLHILTPCPTGWRYPASKSIEVGRLGVQSWISPLYEVDCGVLNLTVKPKPVPVKDYFALQKRYSNLTPEDIERIQKDIDANRERLLANNGKNIWL